MSHDLSAYLPKSHPLSPEQRATLLRVAARTGSPSLRVLFDHIAYLEQDNRGSRCGVNHSLAGDGVADPASALCVECAEQSYCGSCGTALTRHEINICYRCRENEP